MKSFLKKLKLNNKGDTLAIVLIGIVVVGVIGTVIMQSTFVNYRMKVSNLKTKQNFYYTEMAIDDIYSKLGKEVSDSAEQAYNKALASYVQVSGATYNMTASADDVFRNTYIDHFQNHKDASGALDYAFSNVVTQIDDVVANLNSYINTTKYSSLGVTITVSKVVAATAADSTYLTYEDVDGDSKIDRIAIRNVKVTGESGSQKYISSITTDFVVDVPDIKFDFSDVSEEQYDKFFEYALVASGEASGRDDASSDLDEASIVVGSGSKIVLNGNLFAGDYHNYSNTTTNHKWVDKEGISIGDGASFVTNSGNVLSRGKVILKGNNSKFEANGESLTANKYIKDASKLKSLRVYAKDLILEGQSADMQIKGDAYVKDDLEVNGNSDNVTITGSYYGFGYNGDESRLSSNIVAESNSSAVSGFRGDGTPVMEHELRSAVIVNGDSASVKLTTDGNKQFVVGGRAFIDLTTGVADGTGATYMTAESVSVKGNQKIYLIDNPAMYQNTADPNKLIKGNPSDLSQLLSVTGLNPYSYTKEQLYSALGLDTNNVIAKLVGTNGVYFYMKENNPSVLTERVADMVRNTTNSAYSTMVEAVGAEHGMDVRDLTLGAGTTSYTVGTAIQASGGALLGDRNIPYEDNGISEDEFCEIIKDVRLRYGNMMYNITDDRDDMNTISNVGSSSKVVSVIETGKENNSPFDNFINRPLLDSITSEQVYRFGEYTATTFPSGTSYAIVPTVTASELAACGMTSSKFAIVVRGDGKNDSSYSTSTFKTASGGGTTAYGILITTGNVKIDCDFEGMIIAGGNITVDGDHTFTANPDLIQLIRRKSDFMHTLLSGSSTPKLISKDGDLLSGLDANGFTFDTFLTMENWRKNAD